LKLVVLLNQPLAKVVEDMGKLGKGLTKQHYVVIVGVSAGKTYRR
jgi:hypothetical protein